MTGAAPVVDWAFIWAFLAAYVAISVAAGFLFIKFALPKITFRLYVRQYWRDHPYGPLEDTEARR